MLEMSMSPEMGMRVTPALLSLTHMLTLPILELQHLVQQELDENPALEQLESAESSELPERDDSPGAVSPADLLYDEEDAAPGSFDEDTADPLLFVAAPWSMTETLLADLRASLPAQDYPLAVLLVGSLDERGFLHEDLDDIAATLHTGREHVITVLQRLQELGPPGIATPDLQTCLLSQLATLEEAHITCPHAQEIICHHLDDLAAHRYKYIAQQLHISIMAVETVRKFMQRYLWPYPLQLSPDYSSAPQRSHYILPDIAVIAQGKRFVVEVLHSPRHVLRLSPVYENLARHSSTLDAESRTHVQDYIARARTFLINLRQRETTLKQVAEAIVEYQGDFLRSGVRHLAPLTRATIAAYTGLHESTVSRAIANKTALLPNGLSMPLSDFFAAAHNVQDVLRELIANEQQPLSDLELARILTERGYPVARRTVAKYREQMHILPSKMR